MNNPFNLEKYLKSQKESILKRKQKFSKLYLEIGGFITQDNHASRILPGYLPDTKLQFLTNFKDAQLIYCVNSKDITINRRRKKGKGKLLSDFVIRDLEKIVSVGINKPTVALTMFEEQENVLKFIKQLKNIGYDVHTFSYLDNYPTNTANVLSEKGFGKYDFIQKNSDIVFIVGSGGNSGKMTLAISQIYLDKLNKTNAGFAKFETFPVWNLSLNHPVNIAYEFATVGLNDENLIDKRYLEKYGFPAVTYNRDVKNFIVLNSLLKNIFGKELYYSPTEMGINMIKIGIENADEIWKTGMKEIEERYKFFKEEAYKKENLPNLYRCKELIKKHHLT
jgi:uncharacterized protein (UPF0371 family)